MARPKGSKNKSTIEKEAATAGGTQASPSTVSPPPAAGHNSTLSKEARRALLINGCANIEEIQEKIGTLVSAVRTERKELKAIGFNKRQVDFALSLRKNDPKEEADEWRALQEVAEFLSHVIWTQPDLLDGIDRTPAVEKANELGFTCGAEGKKPCDPPYDASTPQGQEWIRGWHEGQASIVAARMKPLGSTPAPGSTEPDFGEVLEDAPNRASYSATDPGPLPEVLDRRLKGEAAFRENVEAGDQHIRDTAAELAGQKETTH